MKYTYSDYNGVLSQRLSCPYCGYTTDWYENSNVAFERTTLMAGMGDSRVVKGVTDDLVLEFGDDRVHNPDYHDFIRKEAHKCRCVSCGITETDVSPGLIDENEGKRVINCYRLMERGE